MKRIERTFTQSCLASALAILAGCGGDSTGPNDTNAAPSIAITSPAHGASYSHAAIPSLNATATDAEDGDLSASIAWTSSIDGALGTGATITPSLSIGPHTIKASVTDSGAKTSSTQRLLSILANTAPALTITDPESSLVVTRGTGLTLTATATDTEDGDLTATIEWTSSIDGALGIGTGIDVTLTVGAHIVTARVEDSEGVVTTATVSVDVHVIPHVTQIASTWSHTCAVALSGAAYCWGPNDLGAIGDGTRTQANSPTAVSGGLTFASITAGHDFTCGLTTARLAYCWGLNHAGQLGDDTKSDRLTPVGVAGGLRFAKLTAGGAHVCGLTLLGIAYCWGTNSNGEIGNGGWPNADATAPTLVSGGHVFVDIEAVYSGTCGITVAGPTYCWGSTNGSRLGVGDATGVADEPLPLLGGLEFTALGGGNSTLCGLVAGGAAYCWGGNEVGEVGNGSTAISVPSPEAVVGGLTFVRLAGGVRTSCGIEEDGTAHCWGDHGYGELGIGTMDIYVTSPTPIAGGVSFAFLGMGYRHSCGLTGWGEAYCWGDNFYGELGDGGVESRVFAPIPTDPF